MLPASQSALCQLRTKWGVFLNWVKPSIIRVVLLTTLHASEVRHTCAVGSFRSVGTHHAVYILVVLVRGNIAPSEMVQ